MMMTPSKSGLRQDDPKAPVMPEWMTAIQKHGAEASSARDASVKSRAWWDLLASMIVGRR